MSLLTDFEIENFRCFDTFKMHNIKRINLIGGMNNAGKTALLEALFFLDGIAKPPLKEIYKQMKLDKLPDKEQNNNNRWLPFFYKGRTDQFIKLKSKYEFSQTWDIYARTLATPAIKDFFITEMDALTLIDEVSKQKAGDFLYQGAYVNGKTTRYLGFKQIYTVQQQEDTLLYWSVQETMSDRAMLADFRAVYFFPDTDIFKNASLVELYNELKRRGYEHKLLSAFQLIEPTIESIEILNLQNPAIYLTRKGEHIPLALSCFGDAMVKIAAYTIGIINNFHSILLLDEVENGIHHTNQPKFWAWLFDLAKEFDVQIFATTHSREMIEAYAQTAIEKDMVKEAVYYELYRDASTAQVKNHRITVDTIPFKLKHNEPIRGERT